MSVLSDLVELMESTEFRTGLRLGLAALVVGWVLYLAFGRRRLPLPLGGLVVAAATAGGLYLVGEELGALVPALLLIVAGAAVSRFVEGRRWMQPLAVLPGALWFALGSNVTDVVWVRVLMAVLIPVAGFLVTDFELRHDRMGLGQVFFTLAVLGVFVAVPDTEEPLLLTAVCLPMVFLAWPKPTVALGPEGAYAAVAMFFWVAAAGGSARPASIIGAFGCLGLLLLEPVVVALRPRAVTLVTWIAPTPVGTVVASIPQLVVVFVCSRIAAHRREELLGLLIVLVAYTVTLMAGVLLASDRPGSREEPA